MITRGLKPEVLEILRFGGQKRTLLINQRVDISRPVALVRGPIRRRRTGGLPLLAAGELFPFASNLDLVTKPARGAANSYTEVPEATARRHDDKAIARCFERGTLGCRASGSADGSGDRRFTRGQFGLLAR